MFQQFYKDTLGGRYIKSLLAQTPIPVFESVVDGDHIIAGCYYVYKRFIIKCNTSGVLLVDEQKDILTPSNTLYPSVFLFPGTGLRAATFYVKSIVDEYNPKTHSTFVSSTNYYDAKTHYHLGRYLRYELTKTGLNLFPFYNCYNGTRLTDVELDTTEFDITVFRTRTQKYKVVAIPILFGHTYTVAIDCPTEVLMRAIIYDDTGFIDAKRLPPELVTTLDKSGARYTNLMFTQPVKFRVETDSIQSYMFQRDLYLVIQLPITNDSSIVVLENFDNTRGVHCNKDGVRNYDMLNPSLLAMNTKKSYAFSDRLIEYLVGNIVHEYDPVTLNIANVQTNLSKIYPDYKRTFITRKNKYGVWNSDIGRLIMSIAEDYSYKYNIYDQDGNLNKDIAAIIDSIGGA